VREGTIEGLALTKDKSVGVESIHACQRLAVFVIGNVQRGSIILERIPPPTDTWAQSPLAPFGGREAHSKERTRTIQSIAG